MNRIRPRQKRSLNVEALEGRLTLSAGLAMASPHAHTLSMSRPAGSIPASFEGHTTIVGSTETTPDLTGRIGKDRFAGSGSTTTSGTIVQGGNADLSNSEGTIQFTLGTASVTKVGKSSRQDVPIVVVKATGTWAQYAGATGMLTTWNVPDRPHGTSTFSGYLDPT